MIQMEQTKSHLWWLLKYKQKTKKKKEKTKKDKIPVGCYKEDSHKYCLAAVVDSRKVVNKVGGSKELESQDKANQIAEEGSFDSHDGSRGFGREACFETHCEEHLTEEGDESYMMSLRIK